MKIVERVVRSTRVGRLAPARVFVDPLGRTQRASVLLGSARSGTTKLAEILSAGRGIRLIREPLHVHNSPVVPPTFVWGEYLAPDSADDELRAMLVACLRGRLRDPWWSDRWNETRVARRRLVKFIAGTNLTGWMTATFPKVPVAYVVRHPFAVSHSVSKLYERERSTGALGDWHYQVHRLVDDLVEHSGLLEGPLASRADEIRATWRAARSPFDRTVLRWCLENYLVLTAPPPNVRVFFFGDVFLHPKTRLPELADHLAVPLTHDVYECLDRPSKTAESPHHRTIAERIFSWTHQLDPSDTAAGLATLELFNLHRYYDGTSPLPLCMPTEAS